MSSFNCCFLTCIQISQEADQVVWYSHLFQNFPVYCDPHSQRLWHSQYSRNRCFFWNSLPFSMIQRMFLVSGSSAFSKTSLNIRKFMVHILLKPGLENFEHYFTSVWDECNCVVVCAFFGIAFLWDWNENWPFPVVWPGLSPYKIVQYTYLIYYLLTMSLSWKIISRRAVLVSHVPDILRTLSDILQVLNNYLIGE